MIWISLSSSSFSFYCLCPSLFFSNFISSCQQLFFFHFPSAGAPTLRPVLQKHNWISLLFCIFFFFSPSSGLLVHFRFSARRLQQLQERRWDKRRKLAEDKMREDKEMSLEISSQGIHNILSLALQESIRLLDWFAVWLLLASWKLFPRDLADNREWLARAKTWRWREKTHASSPSTSGKTNEKSSVIQTRR